MNKSADIIKIKIIFAECLQLNYFNLGIFLSENLCTAHMKTLIMIRGIVNDNYIAWLFSSA